MKPTVDFESGDVTFSNGKVDNIYEAGDIHEFQFKGENHYVCVGHEEVVIWDAEGNRIFSTHTR